jgi:hypothetical protein
VISDPDDGERLAYITLTERSGEQCNFVVPNRKAACHLASMALGLADQLPE